MCKLKSLKSSGTLSYSGFFFRILILLTAVLKLSRVLLFTASGGSEFQRRMALGKKEDLSTWVLAYGTMYLGGGH